MSHLLAPRLLARRLLVPLLLVTAAAGAAGAAGAVAAPPGGTGTLYGARIVRAAAPLGLVSGPDVSSHQHAAGTAIGWGRVASSGRAFAIVKATEGSSYTNPYFRRDWAGMRSAALIRAAYHYARPALPISTAADQARRFVATVAPTRESGTLPLVLDMEEAGGLPPAQLQAWTRQFLSTVETLTGRTPIVYTYPWFWRVRMADSRAFTRYPLWIASYSSGPPSPLPGGWPAWTLWQYTYRGNVKGVAGGVDVSVFRGSPAALAALANGTASPLAERYASLGGAAGVLGAPVTREFQVAGGRGRDYAGGSLYWSPSTGAQLLTGPVRARYRGLGGPASLLGFPLSDAGAVDGAPGATAAIFTGGRLYAGPLGTTAWLLPAGPVLESWLARGSVTAPLGLPLADVVDVPGGTAGTFAGGQLLASPDRGAHELHGGVLAAWVAAGGPASAYGLPSSDVYAVPGGSRADFGGLSITAAGP